MNAIAMTSFPWQPEFAVVTRGVRSSHSQETHLGLYVKCPLCFYSLHPVVLHVTKVYLEEPSTQQLIIKPILKCLIFGFFYFHSLHVSIYQDHYQMIFL
jgi:hypothetical protein